MKLYKSLLLAFTALTAVGLTSCEDEAQVQNYNAVGADDPGVYFCGGATKALPIVEPIDNLILTVGRTDKSEAASYALTTVITDGNAQEVTAMFSQGFPTSVEFEAGEAIKDIAIPYDGNYFSFGTQAAVEFSVPEKDATVYGASTLTVNISRTEYGKWETITKDQDALYYYQAFGGADAVNVYQRQSVLNSAVYQVQVYGWYTGIEEFEKGQPDPNASLYFTYNDQTNIARIPQNECPSNPFGGKEQAYYADLYIIYGDVLGKPMEQVEAAYGDCCKYDPEAGRFDFTAAFYYLTETGISWTGPCADYLQLPGFGDYGIYDLSVPGCYLADGVLSAIVNAEIGPDCEMGLIGIVKTEDPREVIAQMNAVLSGEADAVEIPAGKSTSMIPTEGEGSYFAYIMTFKATEEGLEMKDYDYVPFEVSLGTAATQAPAKAKAAKGMVYHQLSSRRPVMPLARRANLLEAQPLN